LLSTFDVIRLIYYIKNVNVTSRRNVSYRPHLKAVATLRKRGKLTVLYIAALDKWDKCMDDLTFALQQHLRKQQRNFSISITLPFPFFGDIRDITRVLKSKIDELPSGNMNIGSGGKVEWESMPFIVTHDSSSIFSQFFSMSSPVAIFASSEGGARNAFAQWRSFATMPEEDVNKANKLLFNSLRNTLNGKQDQMPHKQPSLLVVRLGHPRLLADRLIEKIQERIWPNPDYDWLTGIVLLMPSYTWLILVFGEPLKTTDLPAMLL
jgi:hypothetical protein